MGIEFILDDENIKHLYEEYLKSLKEKVGYSTSCGYILPLTPLNEPFVGASIYYRDGEFRTSLIFNKKCVEGPDFRDQRTSLVERLNQIYEIPVYSPDNYLLSLIINLEKQQKIKVEPTGAYELNIGINCKGLSKIDKSSEENFKKEIKFYLKFIEDFMDEIYNSFDKKAPDLKLHIDTSDIYIPDKGSFSLFGLPQQSSTQIEQKILMPLNGVTWNDIGGLHDAKEELKVIAGDIIDPESCYIYGKDPAKQKGYLLVGPTGCGKTLLIKALGHEIILELGDDIKIYSISYNDIGSVLRAGEKGFLNMVFSVIGKNEKSNIHTLLFIDELHSTGIRKIGSNESLDSLLVHLDGVKQYKKLTVVGATYRAEDVDEALQRRLPSKIKLGPFDDAYVKETFEVYVGNANQLAKDHKNNEVFEEIDYDSLAKYAKGFLGHHIAEVVDNIQTEETKRYRKTKEFIPITTQRMADGIEDYKKAHPEFKSTKVGFIKDE